MNKNDLLLYVITDCDNLQGEALLARTEAILASGATMLQYRDKHGKARQNAEALKALCHKYNVPFIVNDDVALALALDADGVHVGQEDTAAASARAQLGPDKIVGVTARTGQKSRQRRRRLSWRRCPLPKCQQGFQPHQPRYVESDLRQCRHPCRRHRWCE